MSVATGNDGPDPFSIQSPATTPWVISVGATSRAGSRVTEALRIDSPAGLARDYESREGAFTPPLKTVGPLSGALILANDGSTETPDGDDGTVYDACTPLDEFSRDQRQHMRWSSAAAVILIRNSPTRSNRAPAQWWCIATIRD